jgi:hypothetical protein
MKNPPIADSWHEAIFRVILTGNLRNLLKNAGANFTEISRWFHSTRCARSWQASTQRIIAFDGKKTLRNKSSESNALSERSESNGL